MYGWVPLLFTWNHHNFVNCLYPNTKCFWCVKEGKKKNQVGKAETHSYNNPKCYTAPYNWKGAPNSHHSQMQIWIKPLCVNSAPRWFAPEVPGPQAGHLGVNSLPAPAKWPIESCCCSVAQCCLTLQPCGLQQARLPCVSLSPVLAQTHVHWVSDAIQPCHPLTPPSPFCLQSFPSLGSFPVSRLFASGRQITFTTLKHWMLIQPVKHQVSQFSPDL